MRGSQDFQGALFCHISLGTMVTEPPPTHHQPEGAQHDAEGYPHRLEPQHGAGAGRPLLAAHAPDWTETPIRYAMTGGGPTPASEAAIFRS